MASNRELPTPDEVIESITEWPVDYTSSVDRITNPSSLSSFFLRHVGKPPPKQTGKSIVKPSEPEVTVDISLARWWRKEGKSKVMETEAVPDSHNPHTIINFAARTQAGTEFILQEIKRLRAKLESGCKTDDVYSALSSFYEQILNFSLAKLHLEAAVEKNKEEAEYVWRLKRLKHIIQLRREQEELLMTMPKELTGRTMSEPREVQRVSADQLSFREFFFSYALTSTPVIITGAVDKMTSQPWTLQHVAEVAGDCLATLKRPVPESVKWAKLEEAKTVRVKDFITELCNHSNHNQGNHDNQEKLYLFDWCLPTHCPHLAQELTIPKYFAGDFLQRTPQDTYYRESFPSLFIAPAGITSELHVDTFGSNFWMALFMGRKRWTFFNKCDTPKLYPAFDNPRSSDPVFNVDLASPDLSQYPLLSLTQPLQCVLEPGELLFVPAGCPHRVENLETSLAISGNYVDLSNFDQVKQELEMAGIIHSQSKALFEQLSDSEFPTGMDSEIKDLEWEKFKSWSSRNDAVLDITEKDVQEYRKKLNK